VFTIYIFSDMLLIMKKDKSFKNKEKSIEELVFDLLQKGSISINELIKEINRKRNSATKQGVYRVLRKLNEEEKILIHNKNVSLNLHYLKKMSNFFTLAEHFYLPKNLNANDFLNLSDKEKISYNFKKVDMLDAFWTHIFYMLNEVVDSKNPIYIYNPHEWFAYARKDTDDAVIESNKNKSRQILLTLSNNDYLDKDFIKTMRSDTLQCNINTKKIFKKDNYYLSVLSDYIIEVFLDEKISKEIDKFFKEIKSIGDKEKEILQNITSKNGKNKLIISRDKKKVEVLKKILGKDFYIKK